MDTNGFVINSFGGIGKVQEDPAVGFDGTNFFVIWSDFRGGIWGTRVSANGTVLDTTGFPVSGTASGRQPDLAFDGTQFLVVWNQNQDIFAKLTTATPDVTPPTISNVTANPSSLWPPNHQMMVVTVSANVIDNADPAPTFKITSVSSNEPVDGLGSGDISPDWMIIGDHTVQLRAERTGTGSGRIYTITITASDKSGNTSSASVNVAVPHDQGKK